VCVCGRVYVSTCSVHACVYRYSDIDKVHVHILDIVESL